MSKESIPSTITVSFSDLVNLSVEYWRLATCLTGAVQPSAAATAGHALRKMHDFLKARDISVADLDNHPFDAGMAVRVVDTVDDPALPEGQTVIDETVSPLILWRGQVVRNADVVTRKGTGK